MHVLFTICSFMKKIQLTSKKKAFCYCCYIYGLHINFQILQLWMKRHSIFIYRNVQFTKICIWIKGEKFVRCSFAKSNVKSFAPKKSQNQSIYINRASHSVVVSHLNNSSSSKSVCEVSQCQIENNTIREVLSAAHCSRS